jgi:lipopolysaccharide transport system permease protein
MIGVIGNALVDIRAGLRMHRVWMALAQEDIGDQHKRTALGPAWLLINYLAFAGTFLVVFGHDNHAPNYPAYVAIGLFVWFYILEVINLSVSLFAREESFIKGTTLPLTVYVMRLTAQSVIRAGYALAGCVAILLLAGTPVTGAWLMAAAGLLLLLIATPAAVVVFATIGAFFPDLEFVVQNLMRLGMFLTPVFWVHKGDGGVRGIFYYWNPFTYFLEIVRVPVIAGEIPARSFALCILLTLALWCLAVFCLGRFRKQIVFVV